MAATAAANDAEPRHSRIGETHPCPSNGGEIAEIDPPPREGTRPTTGGCAVDSARYTNPTVNPARLAEPWLHRTRHGEIAAGVRRAACRHHVERGEDSAIGN
jgi:hypothetical protein